MNIIKSKVVLLRMLILIGALYLLALYFLRYNKGTTNVGSFCSPEW